jgi:hypothetical protein
MPAAAEHPPQRSDAERAPLLAARALAVLFAAVWAALSWPALRDTVTTPTGRWPLLAFALGGALGLALAPLARWTDRALLALPRRAWLAVMILLGTAITVWIWFGPMHGQVISSDGCVYLLQGRAAAHGSLGVPVLAPRIAFAVKFLIEGHDGQLHSVFVPGYPVFLAPFVRLGVPWLSGVVVGAVLTWAQHLLAESVDDDPFIARLSVLLLLPSFARGVETADLMSHAFVGALDVLAVVLTLRLRASPRTRDLAALGLCVGWVFSARMLDGFVLAAVCGVALLGPLLRRRLPLRGILIAALCFAPFVALVGAQQRACTGNWRRACVLDYVARGDHPPTCLRLGFGRDVGCAVEHRGERASFGDDGYTPDDALRVVRERTGRLNAETLGLGLLAVVALLGIARDPTPAAVLSGLFPVALTLAYSLFYYGNSVVHGARHVFPAAPFLAVLAARAMARAPERLASRIDLARWRGAVTLACLAMIPVGHLGFWLGGLAELHVIQSKRVPVRAQIDAQRITRGVLVLPDLHSYLADLDPWRDGTQRVMVHDDRAGVLDVRRFFPDLPVQLLSTDGRFLRVGSATPSPGLDLEFERAWPTFQRPTNCGAMILHTQDCCRAPSRGGRALLVFAASPGASLSVPFDLAQDGTWDLALEGLTAFDHGRWEVAVDGQPFGAWEGYTPTITTKVLRSASPLTLGRGPHTFTATCTGRDPRSRDHHAVFDTLHATPAR